MVTRSDVSQAVRTVSLVCVDATRNSNKQWLAWVLPSGDIYVEYGRVGYPQKPHLYACGSVSAAQVKLSQLVNEKLRKGYQPAPVEEEPIEPLDFSLLQPDEAQIIRDRLVRLQNHAQTISQSVNLSFDVNQGVFRTGMGTIAQANIARGRRALQQVQDCLRSSRGNVRTNPQFIMAVEQYLAIVPLKVGMSLQPDQLLGHSDQVQSQFKMLEELEWGLAEIAAIRGLIQQALMQSGDRGSDERARWLHWGEAQEQTKDDLEAIMADERARWTRW